jgi:hypothetical protein
MQLFAAAAPLQSASSFSGEKGKKLLQKFA